MLDSSFMCLPKIKKTKRLDSKEYIRTRTLAKCFGSLYIQQTQKNLNQADMEQATSPRPQAPQS